MAEVKAEQVRALREATGAGMMDCKRALEESGGDFEKAKDWLRQKGITKAAERAGRVAREGVIGFYHHHNHQVGTMVELNSESDFVSRNDIFRNLARELAIQVAGASPRYVSRDEVPEDLVNRERDIAMAQAREQGKPEGVIEKLVQGKMDAFFAETCLMEQKWAKEPKRSIKDLVDEAAAQLKENIVVSRFARYQVGEAPSDGDG
jgi:elongation factor Ts